MLYLTENFCDRCGATLTVAVDGVNVDRFWSFKTGRIKCRECGFINRPCNECFGTDIKEFCSCMNCPWNTAEVLSCMTDEEDPRIDVRLRTTGYALMPVPYKVLGLQAVGQSGV